eukprot:SAG11_NODE_16688_length_540_cov_1.226757_1_plen_62_part_00
MFGLGGAAESVAEAFDELDADGDGMVTREELLAQVREGRRHLVSDQKSEHAQRGPCPIRVS